MNILGQMISHFESKHLQDKSSKVELMSQRVDVI